MHAVASLIRVPVPTALRTALLMTASQPTFVLDAFALRQWGARPLPAPPDTSRGIRVE